MVAGFRMVFQAAQVPLTRTAEAGRLSERLHVHCARVSGAQWLISLGLALHLVMLVGQCMVEHCHSQIRAIDSFVAVAIGDRPSFAWGPARACGR